MEYEARPRAVTRDACEGESVRERDSTRGGGAVAGGAETCTNFAEFPALFVPRASTSLYKLCKAGLLYVCCNFFIA